MCTALPYQKWMRYSALWFIWVISIQADCNLLKWQLLDTHLNLTICCDTVINLDWLQDQCFPYTSLHSNALCHWKPPAVLKLLLCHFFPNLAFWRALENPTEVRESVANTAWTCRAIAAGLSSTLPAPVRTIPTIFLQNAPAHTKKK